MHVYEWLASLHTVSGPAPIAVKIGPETYHGASYAGKDDHRFILYLLGNVPPAYKRSRRVCWRFPGDEQDWYLAAFADAAVAAAMPEFHPFGAWFQLRAWPTGFNPHTNSEWESIDHFEDSSYRRMKIEEVY